VVKVTIGKKHTLRKDKHRLTERQVEEKLNVLKKVYMMEKFKNVLVWDLS
jgi:hypothetical protein